jgi:hypothetical protein
MVVPDLWREGIMAVGIWVPGTVIIAATPFGYGIAASRGVLCGAVSGFLLACFGLFTYGAGCLLLVDFALGSVLGADLGAIAGTLTCAIKNTLNERPQRQERLPLAPTPAGPPTSTWRGTRQR